MGTFLYYVTVWGEGGLDFAPYTAKDICRVWRYKEKNVPNICDYLDQNLESLGSKWL
jgi:hypothetical protein